MVDQFQAKINAFLQSFQRNPAETMNQLPPKYDAKGEQEVLGATLFDKKSIDKKDYIEARDVLRQRIYHLEEIAPGREAYEANDRPEALVDELMYSRLQSMEENDLMRADLETSPWSDDYWAIYKGILGCRYADPDFPSSTDWRKNFDYIREKTAGDILSSGDAVAIDLLSPSEKYDALIGDANETLTRRMWSEGKYYYEAYGEVETWMGICHGWAPAAYMLPRPTRTVTVPAVNGTPITFYPSDIKALATLLWAKAPTKTRLIGGRCNDKDPEIDPDTGRIISSNCFDTNPGAWHLAVVNQLGASLRSMVIDAVYDYQVWNQPIKAYEYRYFNPQMGEAANSLPEATTSLSDFNNDKFRNFRSGVADSVVGIVMSVTYMVETRPNHKPEDDASCDGVQMVVYYYDIELDAAGRIIGGEWYNNRHPDFLWTPPKAVKAQTSFDYQATGNWESGERIPAHWQSAAQQSSQMNGAPLAAIVERLIRFANNNAAS